MILFLKEVIPGIRNNIGISDGADLDHRADGEVTDEYPFFFQLIVQVGCIIANTGHYNPAIPDHRQRVHGRFNLLKDG